jgi:hypothetical protein
MTRREYINRLKNIEKIKRKGTGQTPHNMEGASKASFFLVHKGLAFLSFNDHCQAEYLEGSPLYLFFALHHFIILQ